MCIFLYFIILSPIRQSLFFPKRTSEKGTYPDERGRIPMKGDVSR